MSTWLVAIGAFHFFPKIKGFFQTGTPADAGPTWVGGKAV